MSRTLKINIPARDQKVYDCFVEQKKLYPAYKWRVIIQQVAIITGTGGENVKYILRKLKNLTPQ